jgi:succinyl-CoA synthetase beta subunit
MARRRLAMTVPMVIRLIGTNEEAGRALLEGEGLKIVTDMTEAVNEAVVADRRFSGDMR